MFDSNTVIKWFSWLPSSVFIKKLLKAPAPGFWAEYSMGYSSLRAGRLTSFVHWSSLAYSTICPHNNHTNKKGFLHGAETGVGGSQAMGWPNKMDRFKMDA